VTILVSPLMPAVEDAIDWLTARGATEIVLWLGPDGTYRGNGRVRR